MGFSQRLAKRRKELGLTQQGLADKAGVHMMQIHRYESGNAQPSLDVLKKLTVALRLSADYLLFEEGERGPSDELRLQFEAVSQLDPDEKEVVRNVLEGLLLKNQAKKLAQLGR